MLVSMLRIEVIVWQALQRWLMTATMMHVVLQSKFSAEHAIGVLGA